MCPPPASGSPALSGTSACSLAESWRLDSFLWTDNKLTVTLCYTDSAQDLKFNLKKTKTKQNIFKQPLSTDRNPRDVREDPQRDLLSKNVFCQRLTLNTQSIQNSTVRN